MDLYAEAIQRFKEEFAKAATCGLKEPTSMTLATASRDGRTTIRTVLLKSGDENGFVFYTNLESRKGRDLAENPRASLCFYWGPLEKQVIVDGNVARVSDAEADAYWRTRARDSQIGAWASQQSRPLGSRTEFLARVAATAAKYAVGAVPRPPYWSGFRVVPERIEFWKGMPFRLHERVVYEKQGNEWRKSLVYP
ncbi:MAG: pyridoxamine 5'-phosphate oxidase [Elusimicrobia bacterium]|nr:pyridoxamine 5'-phosphate oxidase [Elusimicrobiota bacterium]